MERKPLINKPMYIEPRTFRNYEDYKIECGRARGWNRRWIIYSGKGEDMGKNQDFISRNAAIEAIAENIGRMHDTPKEAWLGAGRMWLEGVPSVQPLMSPTSMSGTSTRLPFIRPETKKPPMSDRGALDILCGLLGGTVSLYEDSEQIKAAIEVAIQALEDSILAEDDGR